MSDVVIRAEGLGKAYLVGHRAAEPYATLRDSLMRAGREWIRATRDMARGRPIVAGDEVEEFWALRDVNFEIRRGEVCGIIGRNGAGKSTLLKILSRITEPSAGRVAIKGRVASLLEVGTGFHPELSGRENVFLNGAILGMSRAEIARKFDEIVAFAEVETFLDTPVKRYSSGMYVRLAFAVAAHLEPEILVVDEVLAVGDAQFQKKCLGKIGEVAGAGRTVLFVSHNLGAIRQLCAFGILLRNGMTTGVEPIETAIESYYMDSLSAATAETTALFSGPLKGLRFGRILLDGAELLGRALVSPAHDISLTVESEAARRIPDFRFTVSLFREGQRVVTWQDGPADLDAGRAEVTVRIPAHTLRPGDYHLAIGGRRVSGDEWIWGENLGIIAIGEEWSEGYEEECRGLINPWSKPARVMSPAAQARR